MLIGLLFSANDPVAPINLRIIAITCTTVTVSWDEVDGAMVYQVVWVWLNSSDSLQSVRLHFFEDTNATITDLQESSEYSVSVTGLENGGTFLGTSPLVIFTTDCCSNNSNINGNVNIPAHVNFMSYIYS